MDLVSYEVVSVMRSAFCSWVSIASLLGVSISTLERWRKETNFEEPTRKVAQHELDDIIAVFCNGNASRGQRLAVGCVRSLAVRETRHNVRLSMGRVDPIGQEMRKIKKIVRRTYSVAGPNHLWHCDGHHKLIKYGLVTLGCIDGYTRCITYLRCCTNNKSSTAVALLKNAVGEYGMPSRMRGDRGVENYDIARYMLDKRGLNRGSFLAGSSKFNTRIERLWRDVQFGVIKMYKLLFLELEQEGLLYDNNVHKFVLHYVFLDRINSDLQSYQLGWNHHAISTERNRSPLQLYMYHLDKLPPPVEVEDDYGAGEALGPAARGCPLLLSFQNVEVVVLGLAEALAYRTEFKFEGQSFGRGEVVLRPDCASVDVHHTSRLVGKRNLVREKHSMHVDAFLTGFVGLLDLITGILHLGNSTVRPFLRRSLLSTTGAGTSHKQRRHLLPTTAKGVVFRGSGCHWSLRSNVRGNLALVASAAYRTRSRGLRTLNYVRSHIRSKLHDSGFCVYHAWAVLGSMVVTAVTYQASVYSAELMTTHRTPTCQAFSVVRLHDSLNRLVCRNEKEANELC